LEPRVPGRIRNDAPLLKANIKIEPAAIRRDFKFPVGVVATCLLTYEAFYHLLHLPQVFRSSHSVRMGREVSREGADEEDIQGMEVPEREDPGLTLRRDMSPIGIGERDHAMLSFGKEPRNFLEGAMWFKATFTCGDDGACHEVFLRGGYREISGYSRSR
jgi:hypothetical protein